MCSSTVDKFGATPANIQWTVVRGDSASFRVDFLENDEYTHFDTENWTYRATAYDPTTDLLDELEVEDNEGYVIVKASSDITTNWGSGYKNIVAELPFDLQVTIPSVDGSTVWSPVLGTIKVLGNVTPGGL